MVFKCWCRMKNGASFIMKLCHWKSVSRRCPTHNLFVRISDPIARTPSFMHDIKSSCLKLIGWDMTVTGRMYVYRALWTTCNDTILFYPRKDRNECPADVWEKWGTMKFMACCDAIHGMGDDKKAQSKISSTICWLITESIQQVLLCLSLWNDIG